MRIDDENKVVVPDFLADYIEKHYDDKEPSSWDKADLLRDWDNYISVADRKDVAKWVKNSDNFLTFVVAVATNNYIVEQPQRYYWRLKFHQIRGGYYVVESTNLYIDTVEKYEARKLTVSEARELLKDDFDKFEKVEVRNDIS